MSNWSPNHDIDSIKSKILGLQDKKTTKTNSDSPFDHLASSHHLNRCFSLIYSVTETYFAYYTLTYIDENIPKNISFLLENSAKMKLE